MSKTGLTVATMRSLQTAKEIFEIPAVQENWVKTYEKVSGKGDGLLRYEAEKILFMQNYQSNKTAFDKCDKFSLYGSFIELSISGLTLRDGIAYIIPYGDKAVFMPGWKGRLEQIAEMPGVIHVHQPQIVYASDKFTLKKGMQTIIEEHIPKIPRSENDSIIGVYMIVQFAHGPVVYYMDALDVINIRNNYSQSYKQYLKDISDPKVKDGKVLKKYKTSEGEWKEYWKEIDTPMWVSDEAQAFKKTLVKRVYNDLPKLPKHKLIDERLKTIDHDIDKIENQIDKPQPPLSENDLGGILNDAGIVDTDHEIVDTDTGEITKTNIVDTGNAAGPSTNGANDTKAKNQPASTNDEEEEF